MDAPSWRRLQCLHLLHWTWCSWATRRDDFTHIRRKHREHGFVWATVVMASTRAFLFRLSRHHLSAPGGSAKVAPDCDGNVCPAVHVSPRSDTTQACPGGVRSDSGELESRRRYWREQNYGLSVALGRVGVAVGATARDTAECRRSCPRLPPQGSTGSCPLVGGRETQSSFLVLFSCTLVAEDSTVGVNLKTEKNTLFSQSGEAEPTLEQNSEPPPSEQQHHHNLPRAHKLMLAFSAHL